MTTTVERARDITREALPGGAVSVATSWAQRALNAAGESLSVDGRAGPATIAALERFRLSQAPDDTVRPQGEATSTTDRYPARVIVGLKTENALAFTLTQRNPAPSTSTSRPRQTIGPHLDPPTLAPRSGDSWWPWVVAGAAVAALGAGAWYLFGPGASNRAAGGKRVNRRRR